MVELFDTEKLKGAEVDSAIGPVDLEDRPGPVVKDDAARHPIWIFPVRS